MYYTSRSGLGHVLMWMAQLTRLRKIYMAIVMYPVKQERCREDIQRAIRKIRVRSYWPRSSRRQLKRCACSYVPVAGSCAGL